MSGAVVQLNGIVPHTGVVVFDTQTRHLAPTAAYETVLGLARQLKGAIYKKTDSTLRGPIGAEFDALLDAFPMRSIVYAPAYPKLGRTVVNGCLRVNGIPVDKTAFALDPHEPVLESNIPHLIRSTCRGYQRVAVHDSQSDADLAAIATSLRIERDIAAGPGGFAAHWAKLLPVTLRPPVTFPKITRPLVVSGSLHPMSRVQADVARSLGIDVLETPHLHSSAAPNLGPATAAAIQSGAADSLIVFGGDTVRSVLNALAEVQLTPLGEVLPGIPLSLTARGVPLITKAGGFGTQHLIREILERLT